MTRRRALARAVVLTLGIVALIVGGGLWLVGVALLGVSYVVLVASL